MFMRDEGQIRAELLRRNVRNVDLVRVLGLAPDKVSKIKSKQRRMQHDEIRLIDAYLDSLDQPSLQPPESPPEWPALPNEMQSPARAYAPPPTTALARDVPVLGSCLAAPLTLPQIPDDIEPMEIELGDVVEYVRRPPAMAGNSKLYALYVQTGSMEPRHRTGSLIFVDPRRPPAVGDDVIVQLRSGSGHDGEERVVSALLKELVRRTAAGLELKQHNPPLTFFVPTERIKAVHRVPELGEMMGI